MDEAIARAAFHASLAWLDQLKAAPVPLPVGLAARFRSLVPTRDLQTLYDEACGWWHGYAAVMEEFTATLNAAPVAQFIKKGRA